MTQYQYEQMSSDLQSLAKIVPLHWGNIQNDVTDSEINMFQIQSFEELETKISQLTENSKNYFRRRWFLWKSAQCDEYLFCLNNYVAPNPNCKDQAYDIEFNGNSHLRFDVKGTVIPKKFRNDIKAVINDPTPMIQFFYEDQSTGVRSNIQNRLFIVHHSFKNQAREMYLRCHWIFKRTVYREYSEKISQDSNFIKCKNVIVDVIFIFENEDGSFTYKFFAV